MLSRMFVAKTVKKIKSRVRRFFKNQSFVPFETLMAFFFLYSGVAGMAHFGVVDDIVTKTIGDTLAFVFSAIFAFAGSAMFFGLGLLKKNIEASGLILVITSLLIRVIVLSVAVGFSPIVINAYVANSAFIAACLVRMWAIYRMQSLSDKLKLVSLDALVIVDNQADVVFWPPSAKDMFGYAEKEILGKSIDMIIPERYKGLYRKGLAESQNNPTSKFLNVPLVFEAIHKDGSEFPIKVIIRRWPSGAYIYFVCTFRNQRMWEKIND